MVLQIHDGSSDALSIIAIVVAALGALAALWAAVVTFQQRRDQRVRDRARNETVVRLDFVHETITSGPFAMVAQTPLPPPELTYALTLVIRNGGANTEYVTAAFLRAHGPIEHGREGIRVFGNEGAGEFYELARRAAHRVTTELDREPAGWMTEGFVGEVWLGSGARVESDKQHLVLELLEDVGFAPRSAS